MAIFKDFTFDGENSRNYGVYISGPAVYNAPKRSMDLIQVPGRNGALAMDNGYFENIPVTYPAGSFAADQATFAEKIRALRNMLASRYRYCRLTDGYDTNHFRLALYRSGLDVDPVALHRAGEFNIAFDCKPQRYLTSGEETSTADASDPVQETYGPADIVTFESDNVQDVISSAQFAIVPQQDLNGYDSPWPAGGGKNKFNKDGTNTSNGFISGTYLNNAGGTVAPSTPSEWDVSEYIPVSASTAYIISGLPTSGANSPAYCQYDSNKAFLTGANYENNATRSFTSHASAAYVRLSIPTAVANTLQLEAGSTATAYAPYSNICPIRGWTGANIYTKGENLFEPVNVTGTNNGVTFAWVNGICTVTGTATALAINGPTSRTLPAGTYTVINFNSTAGTGVFVSDTSVSPWATIANTLTHTDESGNGWDTFTLTKTTTVAIRGRVNSGVTVDNAVITPMVVSGTVRPSAYAAYTATTIPITWSEAGTVYGGTLEYLGGNSWRVTRTMAAVNPTSVISSFAGTGGLRIGVVATNAKPFAASAQSTAIANMLKSMTAAAQYAGTESAVAVDAQGRCCISVTGITTYDALNSWLSANSLTCVYELSTPQTYDLTADELRTLLGVNNIWSNTGSSTVVVQSPWTLTNPTLWPSKPLIRVYGTGSFTINDVTVTVSRNTGYTDIDCEMMDCYYGGESRNQYVSFSTNDFPELRVLENYITMTGITKLEITPRWWEL